MKKLSLFILMFVFLFSLASCGHKHEYTSTTHNPTCTEDGYTEYTCECGDSYQENIIEALGHSFGEWVTVLEPTEEAEGLKERECRCGEKEQDTIPVLDKVAPVIEVEGVELNVKLNTFKDFDMLAGVKATDNVDGDITSSIVVEGDIDNTTRGVYELVYTVEDSSGNVSTLTRQVRVVWNYATSFIAHAGSYYGVQNSEESILFAAQVLKYQAIEVDVKVTKDGVFVLCHDDTFNGVNIASTTYENLKNVVATSTKSASLPMKEIGKTSVTYTATICTLERFLEICKEYDIRPVLELKGGTGITNSDQSNMGRLMKMVEDAGLLEEVILLGSAYNCLIWTRNNGYENVECQYLVDSCASETYFNRCLEYDFDISICVTYGNGQTQNTPEWIAKYQEAGIGISTYTFTQYVDYNEVQKWINLGVDYVTCDWHVMSKLKHIDNESINTHTVTFLDKDGNILKEANVKDGRGAPAPKAPTIQGYVFAGWDKEISNITSDLTVKALYELEEYKISYVTNLNSVQEAAFANKEEFVNEFYTDFYNWLAANVDNISYLTYNNGTYKMVRNAGGNGTATWTDVASLRALDLYVFESSFIYKPIEGTNSTSYVPEEDNGYFLNSEPYRTKYINLNAYFLNAINTGYSSYSKTYQQQSNNRVQIFFRLHQWANGTNIPAFNEYPTYYEVVVSEENVTLPDAKTYTIVDEFDLPVATGENLEFVGWYLDKECTLQIGKIEKGTTGDITLYAKWK
mgnify:FL=1